ncbi:DNA recombination protein RmuC [Methylobacterium oryzisoli]|uniref:DNA recombination protein RmuC n=1 Tax=Methylobacterium oryzisoli TaxID=3385502 RepID=UPI003891A36E
MVEVLLTVVAVFVAITMVLAALIFLRLSRIVGSEALSRETVAQLLRIETDLIKRAGEEQSRGLREELAGRIRDFRESTTGTFTVHFQGAETQMRTFGERLDAGIKIVEHRVHGIAEKLDADLGQMGASAERNRESLRILVENKLDAAATKQNDEAKSLRDELGQNFHRLGGNISNTLSEMSERQKERLDKTTAAIDSLREKNEQSGETLRAAVEGRLEALSQQNAAKLDEMRQVVDEKLQSTLESRLGESFNRVVEQLNRVHEGLGEMKSLASNVGDLKNVLTNVKVRGTYGEVQLEILLEQFLTRDQYIKDARVKENTTERVEFAIKLPGAGVGEEVLIPIDAKFPRETYDRLIDASAAGDEEAIKLHRKQLEAQVRACAKTICEKYINPPITTNFAILFLPTEGLYAEALRQVGLFECMQREHQVTLAGPTTLAALLNALQMGFRSIAIERRSGEVWKVLGAVRTEFGKYNDVVQKLGNQLATAAKSVDSLGVRTRAMDRKLRDVEMLPEGTSTAALLGFEGEDVHPLPSEAVMSGLADSGTPILVPQMR